MVRNLLPVLSEVKDGCRSYKFDSNNGVKHCYLQSNLYSTDKGAWGAVRVRTPLGFDELDGKTPLEGDAHSFTASTVLPAIVA